MVFAFTVRVLVYKHVTYPLTPGAWYVHSRTCEGSMKGVWTVRERDEFSGSESVAAEEKRLP